MAQTKTVNYGPITVEYDLLTGPLAANIKNRPGIVTHAKNYHVQTQIFRTAVIPSLDFNQYPD